MDKSLSGKRGLIFFLGALTALGPLCNDTYSPFLPLIARSLDALPGQAQLTMSTILLGFAGGQLVYGPLSDRFGRRPLLLLGLIVFMLASIGCAFVLTINQLLFGRFFQGFGAAAGMVLSRAIILDRWRGSQASRVLSMVMVIAFFAPVFAPMLGGWLATFGYWPIVFWMLALVGAMGAIATLILLPRAGIDRSDVSVLGSFLAYGKLLRRSEVVGHIFCSGLAMAGVMIFVTGSPFVFIEYFGLAPHVFGYCFAFVMLGGALGAFLNGRMVVGIGTMKLISFGTGLIAISSFACFVATLMTGNVLGIILPFCGYLLGIGFIVTNLITRTLSLYPDQAGAGAALFGVGQFLMGATAAAALGLLEVQTPLPLSVSIVILGPLCALVWWTWLRGLPVFTD